VRRIGVAVDEHDGDSFHAEPFETVSKLDQRRLVERNEHSAVGAHPLLEKRSARSTSGWCFWKAGVTSSNLVGRARNDSNL